MGMKRIFLIRHGQSLGNQDHTQHAIMPDHAIPLTEEGKRQVECARKVLEDWFNAGQFDDDYKNIRMWVSPYERTRETAQILSHGVYTLKKELGCTL